MTGPDSLRATFFEECEDLLSRMGEGLSRMSATRERADIETVHDVFRAVHSIKGGAGAFGLSSLVAFAHVFETVLDLMRSGKLATERGTMQTLLRAYDVLSDLVSVARDGGAEPANMNALLAELDALADGGADPGEKPGKTSTSSRFPLDILDVPQTSPEVPDGYAVALTPGAAFYAKGHEPAAL
ncbi:MAG: chemotaxis protein CheA, partial [Rhodobacter sp. CACIA14H1]